MFHYTCQLLYRQTLDCNSINLSKPYSNGLTLNYEKFNVEQPMVGGGSIYLV